MKREKKPSDDLRMSEAEFDRIMRRALEVKPPEGPPAKPEQGKKGSRPARKSPKAPQ